VERETARKNMRRIDKEVPRGGTTAGGRRRIKRKQQEQGKKRKNKTGERPTR
jgi:hypothetical protein